MAETFSDKSFLDLPGLTGYDGKVKQWILQQNTNTLNAAKTYAESLQLAIPSLRLDLETMELIQETQGIGIEFYINEDKELIYKFNV